MIHIKLIPHQFQLKNGCDEIIDFDGSKKITGTKIHVAIEQNDLPRYNGYGTMDMNKIKFLDQNPSNLTLHPLKLASGEF